MNTSLIDLRYGDQSVTCRVPAQAEVLATREPVQEVSRERFVREFAALLPSPLPPGLIAIVVADKTRLCDYPRILPWLTELLRNQGASSEQICFYIAYGNHARQTESESLAAYGPLYECFPFIHHQSADQGQFIDLGKTSSGTPVRIRRELVAASLVITIGAISHHYFAGFGGGRKLLFPGLGEQEAIALNHRLFLDAKTSELALGCRSGQLEHNPVAKDLQEIHHLLPPHLSIHGLLDSHGRVAAFRCGSTYGHFLAACAEHDRSFRAPGTRRFSLVLASAGGFPKDINLIQVHKAIDNSASFVVDHGHLIMLAQCRDGIGSSTFLPYFDLADRDAAFAALMHRYSGNGGTALSMMAKTQRITVSLVTDLDDSLCRRISCQRLTLAEAEGLMANQPDMAIIANASMLIR